MIALEDQTFLKSVLFISASALLFFVKTFLSEEVSSMMGESDSKDARIMKCLKYYLVGNFSIHIIATYFLWLHRQNSTNHNENNKLADISMLSSFMYALYLTAVHQNIIQEQNQLKEINKIRVPLLCLFFAILLIDGTF